MSWSIPFLFALITQIDKDRDGFVSMTEFLGASENETFEKDDGWKSVEDETPYTDHEMQEFEKQLAELEQKRLEEHKVAEESIKLASNTIAVSVRAFQIQVTGVQ